MKNTFKKIFLFSVLGLIIGITPMMFSKNFVLENMKAEAVMGTANCSQWNTFFSQARAQVGNLPFLVPIPCEATYYDSHTKTSRNYEDVRAWGADPFMTDMWGADKVKLSMPQGGGWTPYQSASIFVDSSLVTNAQAYCRLYINGVDTMPIGSVMVYEGERILSAYNYSNFTLTGTSWVTVNCYNPGSGGVPDTLIASRSDHKFVDPALLPKPITGTLTLSGGTTPTTCEIATGGSVCSIWLTWAITNPKAGVNTAITSNLPSAGAIVPGTTATSGSNVGVNISYGSRSFYLYHNGVQYDTTKTITASCTSNSVWDGSKCILKVAPVVNVSASSSAITAGGSTTINWSATNATSCTSVNGGGTGITGNFTKSNLTTTATYTVTCTSSITGLTGSGSVTVTVSTCSPGVDTTKPITLSSTITNLGGTTPTGFNVLFQISSNGGTTPVAIIPATAMTALSGTPRVATATYTFVTPGTYTFRAYADSSNAITETNETNNYSAWETDPSKVITICLPKIDYTWSTTTWGACTSGSNTCGIGSGTQTGTQTCIPPQNGGLACPSPTKTTTRSCTMTACVCTGTQVMDKNGQCIENPCDITKKEKYNPLSTKNPPCDKSIKPIYQEN